MSYPDIQVSGAGSTVVNGVYTYDEMYGDKPQYVYSTTRYIYFISNQWVIESGANTYYYSDDDVATPDLVTTWELGASGSSPVPTVEVVPIEGSLEVTLGNVTLDGEALILNKGILEITLDGVSIDAEGTVYFIIEASLEKTLSNITLDAEGEVFEIDVIGQLASTLDNITVTGSGYIYPHKTTQRTSVRVIVGDITFEDEDIRMAKVVEQIDPSGITLPASEFEVEIYTENSDFNIVNPSGDYSVLQYKTPVTVYATVNDTDVLMGKYYLDDWEKLSNNLMHLSCVDLISLLEEMTANGDVWIDTETTTAGDLLERIIRTEYSEFIYEINPAMEDTEIQGWLMNINSREALQKLCFVIGGYARSVRTTGSLDIAQSDLVGFLAIGPSTGVPSVGQSRNWGRRWRPSQWGDIDTITIPTTDQSLIQKTKLKPAVTKIEIVFHSLVENTSDAQEIFTGTLAVGTHTIYFDKPYHTIVVGGNGTLVGTKTMGTMAEVTVATEGQVTITGKTMEATKNVYEIDNLTEGAKDKVIRVDNVFMITSDNVQEIAERLEDYYERRLVVEFKTFGKVLAPGDTVLVETVDDEWIDGVIEKLEIDLATGFVSKVTVVGKVYEEE
jgi:hypothetical protein